MKKRRPISEVIPDDWLTRLRPGGRIGLGLDLATTNKGKSNPTALAVTEQVAMTYYVRLLMRWKTNDPVVTRAILKTILDMLAGVRRRARRLCIDATNERFFAVDLRTALVAQVPVELVIGSEQHIYMGEPMTMKAYLGNLYCNTIGDNQLILPSAAWVRKDARQVYRVRGSFDADVESDGSHADGFDGVKLSLHALVSGGGPAHAEAIPTTTDIYRGHTRPGIKNPLVRNNHARRLLPV